MYVIQHCFICHHSDFIVSEDVEIEFIIYILMIN
jgi:hypothetical protein